MGSRSNNDLVTCKVQLYAETDSAIRVGPPGKKLNSVYADEEIPWVPSSLISHSTLNDIGSKGEIEIPRWLAVKKELAHED